MKIKTDEELAEMLKTGNGEAFSALVNRHSQYFYRVAYRIVLERETAEDIVQNCFLKIWEKPSLWKAEQAKFKTWFYRIICNAAIDDKRRLKMLELPEDIQDERHEEVADDSVKNALLQLPTRQRAAIMLVYYDEMKQADAAKTLGIGVKALESLLSRAKEKLKGIVK